MEWKIAFPLHPEYRTLPMVWYVPPLSPIQSMAEAGAFGEKGAMPNVRSLRIPMKYLANLLTAGDEEPVAKALEKLIAMRAYMRSIHYEGAEDASLPGKVGMTPQQVKDMYQLMAIANYEDRFVIPTSHREYAENAYDLKGGCGFSFGEGCGEPKNAPQWTGLFAKPPSKRKREETTMTNSFKALSALLSYPTAELKAAAGAIREVLYVEALAPRWAMDQLKKPADRDRDARSCTNCRNAMCSCSTAPVRSPCISSSMSMASRAIADRRWSISVRSTKRAGLDPDARELPDFLPMFLEYLSTRPSLKSASPARRAADSHCGAERTPREAKDALCRGLAGRSKRLPASRRRRRNSTRFGKRPTTIPNNLRSARRALGGPARDIRSGCRGLQPRRGRQRGA